MALDGRVSITNHGYCIYCGAKLTGSGSNTVVHRPHPDAVLCSTRHAMFFVHNPGVSTSPCRAASESDAGTESFI